MYVNKAIFLIFDIFIKFNYLIGTNILQCYGIANMPWVTVSPVSANKIGDLIVRAFVDIHLRACKLMNRYFFSLIPVDQLGREVAY